MLPEKIWLWQKAPALRLLVPFVAGIGWQWYAPLSPLFVWSVESFCLLFILLFALLPLRLRFKAAPLQGIVLTILMIGIAMIVVQRNDVRNSNNWFGKTNTHALLLTLQEPLIEKANTYKALATVEKIICHDSLIPAKGKLILYFKKDAIANVGYGARLWVFEKVLPIKNSGNPGGFDYERYSLFQGITHQVYVTATDFMVLPASKKDWLDQFIFQVRDAVVRILKTHIPGTKEAGLAEALLIGYKDDLDKTLVQSYSNTGVVHIIAISGLHVGLIYGLLLLLTKPLRRKKWRWIRLVIVLTALWGFGLLAGAQPSVMRSVVMFSFIALSVVVERNTSVYNNLALSALLLLCYNPFWLWDVGFQLSYIAVLSILIFFKPIYNWIFFQNKLLDAVWKIMAVTLAAQILTTPFSLYYFHQLPLLFVFTNLVAVPLSSLILIGELLLCALSFISPAAHAVGWFTHIFIRWMNGYIERIEAVSFSVWPNLSISVLQAILLLLFVAGISIWLLEKKRSALWFGLSCFLLFTTLRTFSFLQAAQQQQVIVYNIPKHQAIDIFNGRTATFLGDEMLWQNNPATKLNLQPCRVVHRICNVVPLQTKAFRFCDKKFLIIDTALAIKTFSKPHIDVLVLSKNPTLYLAELLSHLNVSQIVLDASVPSWKAARWQHDCDSLQVPCYNVVQNGAFVMPVPQPTFAAR